MDRKANTGSRLFERMAARPMIVIGGAVVITALLAIPFLTMAPTTSASQEPGGPVFDARDAVEEQFVSAVFTVPIIVEARDGNLLSRQELIELRHNTAALRADSDLGPTLLGFFDQRIGADVVGLRTIADAVDETIPGGLEAATDEEVAIAADAVIDQFGPRSDVLGLSVETAFDQGSLGAGKGSIVSAGTGVARAGASRVRARPPSKYPRPSFPATTLRYAWRRRTASRPE